jgi:hypothetical protein
LIGEGQDEALLAHLGILDVQVEAYGGKSNLSPYLKAFPVRPGASGVAALGVTRDADDDVSRTFQSVCSLLTNQGLPTPPAPGQIVGGAPRVGVFLLPDNHNAGMLEDLCLTASRADPAMPCVDEFFRCVQVQAVRVPNNMAKARVHAWLASQLEPDRRLGEAARAGYWAWHDPAFADLEDFLRHF